MGFALLFLIILTIILLIGAYLIWKSDLSDNDKVISMIGILALFSIVAIVNETKSPSSQMKLKYNIMEFEKMFYHSKPSGLIQEYKLPILNDAEEWIRLSLQGNNTNESNSYLFGLMIGEFKNGKTFAVQSYIKSLRAKKIPALYIDIKDSNSNILNLLNYLEIPNLNLFEEHIKKLNDMDKVPIIIIDNIQNAFTQTKSEYETSNCPICEYMKILYDSKKMNILMVTNSYEIPSKIISNDAYALRLKIIYMKERTYETIEKYLINEINPKINDAKHQFNPKNINFMLNNIGFFWDQLNEYLTKHHDFNSVEDFTKKRVIDNGNRSLPTNDIKLIADALLNIIQDRENKTHDANKWVSYGKIKKYITKDLAHKIGESLKARTIMFDNGRYKFVSQAVLNSILVASEQLRLICQVK